MDLKLGAVRRVNAGQEASVTARALGMSKLTPSNWVRLAEKGELRSAGERAVSAERMELDRLRAELVFVKTDRYTLEKETSYFAKDSL